MPLNPSTRRMIEEMTTATASGAQLARLTAIAILELDDASRRLEELCSRLENKVGEKIHDC